MGAPYIKQGGYNHVKRNSQNFISRTIDGIS